MKKITGFTLAALLAGTTLAQAGGMAEPVAVMEPEEIVAATAPSSGANIIVPLILLALIAVASGSSGADPIPD